MDRKRKRHASPSASECPHFSSKTPKKPRILGLSQTSSASDASLSPYCVVTASLYLPLSPKYSFVPENIFNAHLLRNENLRALSPVNGVRKHHLDPLLTKYYEPIGGVVVAYQSIRFETANARIIAECPFAHIWVTVDFLVYKPWKGMVLEGMVNLQSASHIGLLVENTWNVSIPMAKIPKGWTYHEDFISAYPQQNSHHTGNMTGQGEAEGILDAAASAGGWMDDKGRYVDGFLKFQVESVKGGGSIFLLEGSLIDQETIQKARAVR